LTEAGDIYGAISSVPIFSGLAQKELRSVAESGKQRSYKPGDKVVGEGEVGIGFYLILGGKVDVKKGGRAIASLSRGQYFGEMSLIDGERRSADVVAAEPTTCFLLTPGAFSDLMKRNPEIALGLLKEMAGRLRKVQVPPGE
jgi:CRP-like cAMP-binding protein